MVNGVVEKDDFTPVYRQIARHLKEHIKVNGLGDDDLIPSERELCEVFDTSRMTVRQAIDLLVNEGVLVRKKGKGTFVKTLKLRQQLTSLTSFTMDMIGQGMVPTSRMLSCEVVEASKEVAERLNIKEASQVIKLERVRLANDKPHAYECCYLLYPDASAVLDVDFTNRSLYNFLLEQCNLKLSKAKESIEVMPCPKDVCELLKIAKHSLAFHMERVVYDDTDRPVEYVESCYRVDKFRFEVELDLRN